jgi:hypothetical protein
VIISSSFIHFILKNSYSTFSISFPDWASFLFRFFQLKAQNVHRGRGDIDGGCHVRIKSEAYLGSFTPFSQFITGADAIKLYTDVGPVK